MATKQELKLMEMLANEMALATSRIGSDASDGQMAFVPIVVLGCFRPSDDGDHTLAMLDVRAPGILPQGAIAHMLDQALGAARGEPVLGAETVENTIAAGIVPGAEGSMQ